MTEENLDRLVINYLTEEQYKEAKENGEIKENELYCTSEDSSPEQAVLFQGEFRGDNTLPIDVNAYKKLRIYATFNTYINVVYEIDLESPFNLVHLDGYSHGGSGLCQAPDAPQIIYVSSLFVSNDKKSLFHHKIGYINGGSWADRGVNSGTDYKYYIYKIVGIRKDQEENLMDNAKIYSSEEKVVGSWFDKPLYEKTIDTYVETYTTQNIDPADLGIENPDMILIDYGNSTTHYREDSGKGFAGINFYVSETDRSNVYINYAGLLTIQHNTSTARRYHITLRYTKTTD